MPEGDTVWLAGRRLDQALSGRRLVRSDFRVPQLATTDLSGRTVLGVASRGKHLLTRIEGGLTLHTHFKMEGSWQIYRTGQRWRAPSHEIRVVLANQEAVCVGVRLAIVELLPSAKEADAVGHLGPDLLAEDWGPDAELEALQRLSGVPDREIGTALLDQRNFAGLGNMWRCEVLFLRGINPFRPVASVTDLPRLIDLSHRLLLANRERAGQATTGDLHRGASNYVYGRKGLPCRRCHTPIQRASQGDPGYERETYWCPRCQPA
ncbi:MAG TPA: DNA-formamidopyrimidine glycosylase family protein [Frankiaceae bacterium]|jgi:endonuclease-8|nr:DNA-formamidopyrimidine glycosylase family protein [Frankiaceae bacterium]